MNGWYTYTIHAARVIQEPIGVMVIFLLFIFYTCLQSVYGQSLKALAEKNGTTMSFLVQFMNWEGGGKSK